MAAMSAYDAALAPDQEDPAVDYDELVWAACLGYRAAMERGERTASPLGAAYAAVKDAGGSDAAAVRASHEAAIDYFEKYHWALEAWAYDNDVELDDLVRVMDEFPVPEALVALIDVMQWTDYPPVMRANIRVAVRELCARMLPLPDDVVTALSRGLREAMRIPRAHFNLRSFRVDGVTMLVTLDVIDSYVQEVQEPAERLEIMQDALLLAAATWLLRAHDATTFLVRRFAEDYDYLYYDNGLCSDARCEVLARAKIYLNAVEEPDDDDLYGQAWEARTYAVGELPRMQRGELLELL